MQEFSPQDLPDTLLDLCREYLTASGSHALRIVSRTLSDYHDATLADIPEEDADAFLLLRAAVLDISGNVPACRAIYQFAATTAHGVGDTVSEAAALAQLHVDRSLRQDNDTEHGSPYSGAIRLKLLEIVEMIRQAQPIPDSRLALATKTLIHISHGLALMGAGDDAKDAVQFAAKIAPASGELLAGIDLADAEIKACQGHIDEAIEQAELTLGRISPDPLGLQIEVRQFLGTWYRAIGNHDAAATHLRIATELAYKYDMPATAVVLALELVSSLVEIKENEEIVMTTSQALDTAEDLRINNEVVRALDRVLVRTLISMQEYRNAVGCAELAGDRARSYADVNSAVELYYLGAEAARADGDNLRSAGLFSSCAALSTGQDVKKAGFLRLQAREVLANAGISPDIPELSPQLDPETSEVLLNAYSLMQEALALLISTPENEKQAAAIELSQWNHDMMWLHDRFKLGLLDTDSEIVKHYFEGDTDGS